MRQSLRKMGIRPCVRQLAVFTMILVSPNAIAQEAMKIWKVGVLWRGKSARGRADVSGFHRGRSLTEIWLGNLAR
jgi:hypothetical protein